MKNIICIDTNILRSMGPKFDNSPQFKAIEGYCYSSGSEFVIPKVVKHEFLDFYQREIIEKNIKSVELGLKNLKKIEGFFDLPIPELDQIAEKHLRKVEKKLSQMFNPLVEVPSFQDLLIKLIIINKRESKKDNTRDFLIYLYCLGLAIKYSEYQIAIISNDEIFSKNHHFTAIEKEFEINNLAHYKSIQDFLSIYGFRSDNLTNQAILNAIPTSTIENELRLGKNDFPSHLSYFYLEHHNDFVLESLSIQDLRLEGYYGHRNPKSGEIEIVANVEVKIEMIFEPESDVASLKEYLKIYKNLEYDRLFPNTFDKEWRPIYNEWVLFIFRFRFDEATKIISEMEFLDYFPDHYRG